MTLLHDAALEGNTDIVLAPRAAGARADAADSEGDTVLHFAADQGHAGVAGAAPAPRRGHRGGRALGGARAGDARAGGAAGGNEGEGEGDLDGEDEAQPARQRPRAEVRTRVHTDQIERHAAGARAGPASPPDA